VVTEQEDQHDSLISSFPEKDNSTSNPNPNPLPILYNSVIRAIEAIDRRKQLMESIVDLLTIIRVAHEAQVEITALVRFTVDAIQHEDNGAHKLVLNRGTHVCVDLLAHIDRVAVQACAMVLGGARLSVGSDLGAGFERVGGGRWEGRDEAQTCREESLGSELHGCEGVRGIFTR
jgi:hypothetical protein